MNTENTMDNFDNSHSEAHSGWRYELAQMIADKTDLDRFGIEAMYLIGSTKNFTAGPESDIDIMFHFRGNKSQKKALKAWIEGWNHGLAAINSLNAKQNTPECYFDIHIITDEDIKNKNSFASMIGSLNNSARLIKSKETNGL
ncbi:MAG: hypothetical protein R6V32_03715 [Bacteroidales bacterium]